MAPRGCHALGSSWSRLLERRLPAFFVGTVSCVLLLAALARAAGGWGTLRWDVVVLAVPLLFASSALPPGFRGVRRGRVLLASLGARLLLFSADVPPERMQWAVRGAQLLLPALEGLLVLDLALHWRSARSLGPRFAAALSLTGVVSLGLLAALPFSEGGVLPLLPARWQRLAEHLDLLCWALAWGVYRGSSLSGRSFIDREGERWVRRGLLAGVLFFLLGTWADSSSFPLPALSAWSASLKSWGALAVGTGHLWLLAPAARPRLVPSVRRVFAWILTMAGSAAVGAAASGWFGGPFASWFEGALWGALLGGWGALLRSKASGWVARWLAPAGGRWLEAARTARNRLLGGPMERFEDVAAAVLAPMAELAPGAQGGWIFWLDPPREMRLEPSGTARSRKASLPEALLDWLRRGESPWVTWHELEPLRVRRPRERALLETLESLGALFAVRLGSREEPDGLLLVPSGGRRSAPATEELRAYVDLAEALHQALQVVASMWRAQRRVGEAIQQLERLRERCEESEQQIVRLTEENRMLREGRGAARAREPLVTLSPSSRSLRERLLALAPQRVPVWLEAEGGIPVDRYAWQLHQGDSAGPFVVADCAAVRPEDALERLFGSGRKGELLGWVPSAEGGTLFLADLPALPPEAQRALAEMLTTHRRPLGEGSEPSEVRLVASGRLPLDRLGVRGAVVPELLEWLEAMALRVPPLRERREEIEPLVLRALARACRLQGKEPVGCSPEAFELLLGYDWPGNERELQFVVERAVAATEGERLEPDVVRSLLTRSEPPSEADDPLGGTFAEVELRLLRRALRKAKGNKTEAARLLGLKRSTFLGKLRRHGL